MKFAYGNFSNQEKFCSVEVILVPVRGRIEFDLNCLLVCIDVVPLAVRVPAFSDNLNQNFSLWNLGNFRRAVLIRLEIYFSEFVFVEEAARFVVSDVNAGVPDGLTVRGAYYFDPHLYGARFRRLFILFVGLIRWSGRVGRGRLMLGGGLIFWRRFLL